MDKLINIEQLMDLLGETSRQAIYNRISRGTFPVPLYKFGRKLKAKESEVKKYLDSLRPAVYS